MQFPVTRRRRLKEDIISRMPENVITNILDRLPLQEAVRTSILSTNWRFTWTLLTQLVFDDKFFRYLVRKNRARRFYRRNLAKLLLQLKGSITTFVLHIPYEDPKYNSIYSHIVEDINHWIMFLSTKGIKEFTLINNMRPDEPVKLPNHLFFCLELKHLKLHNCCLHPVLGLHRLPKLLGLEFHGVTFDSCKYVEFITRCCPLLENLEISYLDPDREVKLGDIAKLVNLKRLSLLLYKLGTVVTSSDILQLVGSLPKLEKLIIDFDECDEMLRNGGASMRSSASLYRLKTLELQCMDFKDHIMVEFVSDLINGLPNLQTLKMKHAISCFPVRGGRLLDYSKVVCSIKGNLQLQYVDFDFECLSGEKIELRFIESLLAYSPLLKKIVIDDGCYDRHGDSCWSFAMELLKLHRASPNAEIHFK